MAWCARLLAALLLTLGVGAEGAAAHFGASAYIVVTDDFVLPGQPFEVVVADVGAEASVSLRIEHEPTIAALGTIRAAPDGHIVANLVVPADFPVGYAQLFASVPYGITVSTWVLIGERTASTPAPPGTAPWWADPSVLVLLAFLIGAAGVTGYLLLRPRRRRVEAVRATSIVTPRQRKRDRRPHS